MWTGIPPSTKFIQVTSLRNRKLTAPQITAHASATQSSSSWHISTSTAQRTLRESGLYGQIAAEKPQPRKSNKRKTFVWAKKHKEWTLDQWKSVLWSDESKDKIFSSTRRVFVRCRKGERMVSTCIVPTVKHRRGGVMVCGCFAGDTVRNLTCTHPPAGGRFQISDCMSTLRSDVSRFNFHHYGHTIRR